MQVWKEKMMDNEIRFNRMTDIAITMVEDSERKGRYRAFLNGSQGIPVTGTVVTTEEIVNRPRTDQKRLWQEIDGVVSDAFPKMTPHDREEYVGAYFKLLGKRVQRQGILFREDDGRLVAACLFDQGEIEYENRFYIGGYSILRAIRKEYQSSGMGQLLSSKVLMELQPDIFLANTYQSNSLHAWIRLVQNGFVTGYEVYPHFENVNGRKELITAPFKKLDFIISAFRQVFIWLCEKPEIVEKEIRNMTVYMARKNNHNEVYPYDPWRKDGREDVVAKKLGVTYKDGVMVVFIKKNG